MKLKENWKRFWTLDRHHAAGFTLVELIVVIAILAILAGVAIPVYSGYIKRANEAADQQLLAAVNTAFAAACLENGVNAHTLTSSTADINLDANGKVDLTSIAPANVAEAFARYYAGNENVAFKAHTELFFDGVEYIFKFGATQIFEYGGGYITLTTEDIQKLIESGFITYEGLGVDALLDKVGYVTDFAAGLQGGTAGNLLYSIFNDPGFISYAGEAMGITNPEDFYTVRDQLVAEMVEKGIVADTAAGQQQLYANAAVLYAANSAITMDQKDIIGLLSGEKTKDTIIANITEKGNTEAFAQAALAYGMYTAFAFSDKGSPEAQEKDPLGALNDLDNPAFKEYISSPQGAKDLEGYIAALSMINGSSKDKNAVSDLLVNGFDNDELKSVVGGAIGN